MHKHYHLVGIGGIGMSGIAKLLIGRGGIVVSGSDLKESRITRELAVSGADFFIGHNADNIRGADCVVYSSAIKEDNPEIKKARENGIPVIKRAEALVQLMQDKTVITVAGSHGKTTTTSLVSYLLIQAGLNPTAVIGGILKNIEANAYSGKGDFFTAEADESDGSFLCYRPKYSIITNIDREHLDYYKDFQAEIGAFRDFINKTDKDGCVFACGDDINLRALVLENSNRAVLFGLSDSADIYAKNICIKGLSSEFDCYSKEKGRIGRFYLNLGGEHNISNALAVIALGLELGIAIEIMQKTLSSYQGASRRLEIKFSSRDYLIIDDYAHHPTEIKATLSAVKKLEKERVVVIFQPHRYSRTRLLLEDFSLSFDAADHLIITDIYPAGEENQDGVSARDICEKIKARFKHKEVYYLPKQEIPDYVLKIIKRGDLILTAGAGDITKINDELVEKLKGTDQV